MNGTAQERPLILVTVGGDHHPFARLMRWTGSWLATVGPRAAECVVQHGTAEPPPGATSHAYLDHALLQEFIAAAQAVVTSGGPSTTSECHRLGIVPIVVPRRVALGEVVDDHQLSFVRRLAEQRLAVLAESESDLHAALDRAISEPGTYTLAHDHLHDASVAASVERIGRLVDEWVATHPVSSPGRRAARRVTHRAGTLR